MSEGQSSGAGGGLWGIWDTVKQKAETALSAVSKDLGEFVQVVDADAKDVVKVTQSVVDKTSAVLAKVELPDAADFLAAPSGNAMVGEDLGGIYVDVTSGAMTVPTGEEDSAKTLLDVKAAEVANQLLDGLDKVEEGLERLEDVLESGLGSVLRSTAGMFNRAVSFTGSAQSAAQSRPAVSDASYRAKTIPEKPRPAFPLSRQQQKLVQLQADPATFCEDPSETDEYAAFCDKFDVAQRTAEIDVLMRTAPVLNNLHTKLVPTVVPFKVFWQRYFFRETKLKRDDERRAALVKRATAVEAEESLSWDLDEDDPQPADGATVASPSGVVAVSETPEASEEGAAATAAAAEGGAVEPDTDSKTAAAESADNAPANAPPQAAVAAAHGGGEDAQQAATTTVVQVEPSAVTEAVQEPQRGEESGSAGCTAAAAEHEEQGSVAAEGKTDKPDLRRGEESSTGEAAHIAEEARKVAEAKKAEEMNKAEADTKKAEAAKRAEDARKAEAEQRRVEEAKRKVEEQARRLVEQRLAEAQKRKAEEDRKHAEEAAKRVAAEKAAAAAAAAATRAQAVAVPPATAAPALVVDPGAAKEAAVGKAPEPAASPLSGGSSTGSSSGWVDVPPPDADKPPTPTTVAPKDEDWDTWE